MISNMIHDSPLKILRKVWFFRLHKLQNKHKPTQIFIIIWFKKWFSMLFYWLFLALGPVQTKTSRGRSLLHRLVQLCRWESRRFHYKVRLILLIIFHSCHMALGITKWIKCNYHCFHKRGISQKGEKASAGHQKKLRIPHWIRTGTEV